MRNRIAFIIVVAGAAALGAVAMNGCGSSCDASNCSGCCDSNNTCQSGASDAKACGVSGAACSACATGQTCHAGICGFGGAGGNNGGNNGGTSSGNGSSTSSTSGTSGTNGSTSGFDCSSAGPCPGAPTPTQQQIAECESSANDANCGADYVAFANCAEANDTCLPDGGATYNSAACGAALTTYENCVTAHTTTSGTNGTSATTQGTTTGSNAGTTTGSNAGTTTGTNSGTTTGTNSGTTGSATFCSGAPARPTLDNGGNEDPCTPADTQFPDGGSVPTQGSCPDASQYCFALFQGDQTRCWAPCQTPNSQTGCAGSTAVCDTLGTFSDGSDANFCVGFGLNDGSGCPTGFKPITISSPEPNEVANVCLPACSTAADCNGSSGAAFTCVNGSCHCSNSATDCSNGAVCDPSSGACIFACTSNSTCDSLTSSLGQSVGCCLQYNGKEFCDTAATP